MGSCYLLFQKTEYPAISCEKMSNIVRDLRSVDYLKINSKRGFIVPNDILMSGCSGMAGKMQRRRERGGREKEERGREKGEMISETFI